MGVLPKREIERRLGLNVNERESLVVTPRPGRESFDADSIDLRLGSFFLLPRVPATAFYCPGSSGPEFHMRVHIPLGEYLVVPAHHTVLGATLEFIKLPFDVSGQILTKSSIGRTFTIIETASWVHPQYRGCLTLEISNGSNTPILLYPGRRTAQLILFEVDCADDRDAVIDSTYFGPVYPEAPKFKTPRDELKEIGVRELRQPPEVSIRRTPA